ncbi:hypothetical protein [Actinoplanes sp. M2I2]|uniref:hypothetical protein n=1 Tax=Actinoplanes sp. M2I2 TaxID=1734444 RepID=UPI0020202807|nr:hypothetical protein [Actinoplanes sp. M2I2]
MRKLIGLSAVLLLAGCSDASGPVPAPTSPAVRTQPPPSAAPCGSPVRTDALPEWARAGFSGDGAGVQHVYGARGDILAVVFGFPLSAPPAEGRNNKILWVSRELLDRSGDLVITARLDGSEQTEQRTVAGGPGPSIVDLPRPGCWRLTLTWPGHTDTMDLSYEPVRAGTPTARSRPPSP